MPVLTALLACAFLCLCALVSGVLLFSAPIAVLPFSCVGGAVFAALLMLCRSRWLFALCPAAFGLTAAVCFFTGLSGGSAAAALCAGLWALFFLPMGVVTAACVYARKSCSASVMALSFTAAGFAALCAGCFVIAVLVRGFDIGALLRDQVMERLLSIELPVRGGETAALFSEEAAAQLIQYVLLLSPALLSLAAMSAAFLTAKSFYLLIRLFDMTALFPDPKWRIRPRKSTAVLYCAAYVLSFLFSTSEGMQSAYFAAENIAVIFTAPFAVVGFRLLFRRLSANASFVMRSAWVLLAVLVAVADASLLLTVAAFFGVFSVLKKKKAPPRSD